MKNNCFKLSINNDHDFRGFPRSVAHSSYGK
jgi:hypothetical protein